MSQLGGGVPESFLRASRELPESNNTMAACPIGASSTRHGARGCRGVVNSKWPTRQDGPLGEDGKPRWEAGELFCGASCCRPAAGIFVDKQKDRERHRQGPKREVPSEAEGGEGETSQTNYYVPPFAGLPVAVPVVALSALDELKTKLTAAGLSSLIEPLTKLSGLGIESVHELQHYNGGVAQIEAHLIEYTAVPRLPPAIRQKLASFMACATAPATPAAAPTTEPVAAPVIQPQHPPTPPPPPPAANTAFAQPPPQPPPQLPTPQPPAQPPALAAAPAAAAPGPARQADIIELAGVAAADDSLGVATTLYLGKDDVIKLRDRLADMVCPANAGSTRQAPAMLKVLRRLSTMPLTCALRDETSICETVAALHIHREPDVAELAKSISAMWEKQLAEEQRQKELAAARRAPAPPPPPKEPLGCPACRGQKRAHTCGKQKSVQKQRV